MAPFLKRINNIIQAALVAFILLPVLPGLPVPMTGTSTTGNIGSIIQAVNSTMPLQEFAGSVQDGKSLVRGVYAEGVMAFRVVQQPAGQAGFVSSVKNVVTEFALAKQYGGIGILAHNFAAGAGFFQLTAGDEINLVYGDGAISKYVIKNILEFQALDADDPYSDFIDLATGETLSSTELFLRTYGGGKLTLQTCIAADGISSWGRMFIIAEPTD